MKRVKKPLPGIDVSPEIADENLREVNITAKVGKVVEDRVTVQRVSGVRIESELEELKYRKNRRGPLQHLVGGKFNGGERGNSTSSLRSGRMRGNARSGRHFDHGSDDLIVMNDNVRKHSMGELCRGEEVRRERRERDKVWAEGRRRRRRGIMRMNGAKRTSSDQVDEGSSLGVRLQKRPKLAAVMERRKVNERREGFV